MPSRSLLEVPRARRMQRTSIAVVTSLLGLLMYWLCWAAGFITLPVAGAATLMVLGCIALFVPVFYTGANLACATPVCFCRRPCARSPSPAMSWLTQVPPARR